MGCEAERLFMTTFFPQMILAHKVGQTELVFGVCFLSVMICATVVDPKNDFSILIHRNLTSRSNQRLIRQLVHTVSCTYTANLVTHVWHFIFCHHKLYTMPHHMILIRYRCV